MPNSAPPPTLTAFLDGEIDNGSFRHVDHVRIGFELLDGHPFPAAAAMFSSALKKIAAQHNPAAYHETITLAFLSLIAERRTVTGCAAFEDFLRANSDLLDRHLLARWYTPERLSSSLARRTFVLPEPAR